jgi:hypothetical protein
MTTFTDREVPSDALAALFVANGSWQAVYTYIPKVTVLANTSPNLVIVSGGTAQDMRSYNTNPTDFRFLLSTWVIARRDSDNFTNAQAETQLNALDKTLRQIIRDNTNVANTWDSIQFEGGFSQVNREIFEGTAFLIETRAVIAHLADGQV